MNRSVPSHWTPRTTTGRVATVLFLLLMALAQPPVVHVFADRVEPWILGVPFVYAYLFVIYVGMIAVLIWAAVRTPG